MKKILLSATIALTSVLAVSCIGFAPSSTNTSSTPKTTIEPSTGSITEVVAPTTTADTTTVPSASTTTEPVTPTTTTGTPTTTTTSVPEDYEKKIVVYAGVNNALRDFMTVLEYGFELEYPGWDVEIEFLGSPLFVKDAISEDLTKENGELPNIAYANLTDVQSYMKAGKLLDLKDYINDNSNITYINGNDEEVTLEGKVGLENPNDFVGNVLTRSYAGNFSDYNKYGYAEDSLLSLPLVGSTDVLYYNKKVFNELNINVPTTWDELWTAARKIKQAYPNSTPFGADSLTNLLANVCEQNGWDYLSNEKPYALFDNDNVEAYLSDLKSKVDEGLFTTQEIYGSYLSTSFSRGEDDGIFMYYGSLSGALYNESKKFEVGIAKTVGSKVNNKVVNKNLMQGPNLCIFDSGNDEVNKMTWLFMKELYDADVQASYTAVSGYAPVIKSAYDSPVMSLYLTTQSIAVEALKVVKEETESLFLTKTFEQENDLLTMLSTAMNNYLKGNLTFEAAINQLDDEFAFEALKLKRNVTDTSNFKNDGIAYATLKQVIDGDDIKVTSSSNEITIRLLSVDTPEEGEALYTEAKNMIKELLESATSIIIDANSSIPAIDSTGERYLAYVWFKTADSDKYQNLNLLLVENGLSTSRCSRADSFYNYFVKAAESAKENKLGIWA